MPIQELSTGSTFAGRYQVIEELGKGGMGRVYKVFDTDIKEKVALKLLRPEIAADNETVERFSNELKLARKIRHKNVCGMFDLGKAEGTLYLTMEFVPGEDLKRLIRRMGQFPAAKAVSVAEQVCDGLGEAHRLGIVHRDLKPSNIMVDEDGNARIMDFGIARSLAGKKITEAGVMIGTPEYMSPEQVEGKEVDERSDIYSLGIILYEMLTGRTPFEGETPLSIAHKHKYEPAADPRTFNPQVPEDLSLLILRCLEKDRTMRWQTAGELRAALEKIEQGLPTTDRLAAEKKPLTSREITVKFNLKKLAVPVFAVVVLAVAAVLLWKFLPHKKAPLAAPKIENSIAVISFKNQTGDPAYDHLQEAIPNLLITNLENTGLFYVATWERMQDILRQMGVKPAPIIDSDLGFEVCRREGIKAIAIGSFTKAGDVFRTDVKVLDAETKLSLKSANTKGTGVDSILDSQIDALSREISLGLGIDQAKVEAVPLSIKDITTPSLQAYDYFLKGKAAYTVNWEEAKKNLTKALEIDPSFAMAYVYLAWVNHNLGDAKARDETIEKAMALSNKTSLKDRLYLEAGHALFIDQDYDKHCALLKELVRKYSDEKWVFHYLGDFLFLYREDFAGAAGQFEKWHKLDPQDASAINHLIGMSYLMGDFKKAAEYVKMHDAVAPPDAYNLSLQGMMYAMMGQFDQSFAKCMEALKIQPDYSYPFWTLTIIHAVREEFEESLKWADEYVSRVSSAGLKSMAYYQRGFYHYWRGKLKDALSDFDLADKMAEETDNWLNKASSLEGKGIVYLARGEFELGRASFENELKILVGHVRTQVPFHKAYMAWRLGVLAAEQKQTDLAEAGLSEMNAMLPAIEGKDKARMTALCNLLQGEVLLAQGDLDGALAAGQKACGPGSPYWTVGYRLSPGYGLPFNEYTSYSMDLVARVFAKKGDVAGAISEYERLMKMAFTYKTVYFVHPLYHYRLGLLYERAGDAAKAGGQYKRFLELWKDADPGRPEVDDAKARLAGLMDR